MPTDAADTTPYWSTTATLPAWPSLKADGEADVVVVGAGITGLTAAYLLAKAGKRVVVLERGRCGGIDTGHTSAHLTMVTDTRLSELVKRFGRDHAQAVWDAGLAAVATINEIVQTHEVDADFGWVDGYLHAPLMGTEADTIDFKEEAALAADLGFEAEHVDAVPFVDRPGVRVSNQGRIQPRAYLAGLAQALTSLGATIHEHSAVDKFCDDPRSVSACGYTVRCEDIVIATHNPMVGLSGIAAASLFQTKLALYTSYVVAGRVSKGSLPDALWWDTGEPYHYLRVEPGRHFDVVIFGGEDHKTGQQPDVAQCYHRLEARLLALLPSFKVTHRWSGQVIETPDGLPYIGRTAEHQYAATGFSGNGLTFGTLAGLMFADQILERGNPWVDLFAPSRQALTRGLWNYVKENADYPYYMLRDRLTSPESHSLRGLTRGHGRVIERQGAKVAAYRSPAGVVTLRSAICPHLGCAVTWNDTERTWDCPCHGSRFTPTGDVISGPAESPLPPAE